MTAHSRLRKRRKEHKRDEYDTEARVLVEEGPRTEAYAAVVQESEEPSTQERSDA